MAKKKKYKDFLDEAVAGLLDTHCKHCGSVRILVRKQKFKTEEEHLQKICADCFRNNDYLPRELLPHIYCSPRKEKLCPTCMMTLEFNHNCRGYYFGLNREI